MARGKSIIISGEPKIDILKLYGCFVEFFGIHSTDVSLYLGRCLFLELVLAL